MHCQYSIFTQVSLDGDREIKKVMRKKGHGSTRSCYALCVTILEHR